MRLADCPLSSLSADIGETAATFENTVILHLKQSGEVANMRHEYETRGMAEFLATMRNGSCVLWPSGGFPGGYVQGGSHVAAH